MDVTIKEWLTTLGGFGTQRMTDIGFLPFLAVMAISLAASIFVAFLYSQFYGNRAAGSMVHRAFPLLGISITGIFICIQFSLPLSLGLLGALSIVRFRTPIKEPEEIGFIMVVIAASLSCATFNMLFLAIILCTAVVALFVQRMAGRFVSGQRGNGMVVITVPSQQYRSRSQDLLDFLSRRIPKGRIESISESEDQSIVSYSFSRIEGSLLGCLQKEVAAIIEGASSTVFFNRGVSV